MSIYPYRIYFLFLKKNVGIITLQQSSFFDSNNRVEQIWLDTGNKKAHANINQVLFSCPSNHNLNLHLNRCFSQVR